LIRTRTKKEATGASILALLHNLVFIIVACAIDVVIELPFIFAFDFTAFLSVFMHMCIKML